MKRNPNIFKKGEKYNISVGKNFKLFWLEVYQANYMNIIKYTEIANIHSYVFRLTELKN